MTRSSKKSTAKTAKLWASRTCTNCKPSKRFQTRENLEKHNYAVHLKREESKMATSTLNQASSRIPGADASQSEQSWQDRRIIELQTALDKSASRSRRIIEAATQCVEICLRGIR